MHSKRSLLMVAAAVLSLAVLVPSVAASSQKPFYLAKVCDTNTHCVVTYSSLDAIPKGTEINYSGPDFDHLTAVFDIKNGSATGHCAIASIFGDPSVPGRCTFDMGTGRLTQLHLDVRVTFDGSTWFWIGSYSFGKAG
jgi:hypothetical protein